MEGYCIADRLAKYAACEAKELGEEADWIVSVAGK